MHRASKLLDVEPLYSTECCPIKDLQELETIIKKPPQWVENIKPRCERSRIVVKNVLSDCHGKVTEFDTALRLDSNSVPKTLVCHDYKGGYLEDRYLTGVNKGNLYSFYNWSYIDIFVYFSHHFITIPPLCWINCAHQNGVKILGTIITEFTEGEVICDEIFKDIETMHSFANHLAELITIFKIDGWLLNIENKIKNVETLKLFVGYLSDCVHEKDPTALVIWYDSVTIEGKLDWQNELNDKNSCFFDLCDGIFTNYVWTENHLLNSVAKAGHRYLDVFIGTDVFGRNTYGGGQFNTYKAAELIRKYNLSMAIFAPGWTHESIVDTGNETIDFMDHFLNKDSAFWSSLWPYLYTYPIITIFDTTFFKGVDAESFDLSEQEQQLSKITHPKYSYLIPNYSEIKTLENKCHCMRLEYSKSGAFCLINKIGLGKEVLVHKLFICDIPASGPTRVTYKKKRNPLNVMDLRLLTIRANGARHVVYLKGKTESKLLVNSSITEINMSEMQRDEKYETL